MRTPLFSLVLLVAAWPRPPCTPAGSVVSSVVVSEILYAPAEGVPEFVEILNRGPGDVDLSALGLADAVSDARPLADRERLLPPGGYVVATRDSAAFAAAFPGVEAIEVARWPVLNNDGDVVRLLRLADGEVLDAVPYTPAWGGAGGRSLERRDPAGPPAHPSNWATSVGARGATPGMRNSVHAVDDAPPRLLLAEQLPGTPDSIVVALAFDEPIDAAGARVQLDGRPPGMFVPSDDATLRAAFAPPLAGGIVEVADVRDLKGNTLAHASTPLARLPAPGDVVLNEILFDPRDDPHDGLPDQPEYVELLGLAPHPLTLRGLFRTDAPDEHGEADTLAWASGALVLPAGGLAVVFAEPRAVAEPCTGSLLALAYPDDLCAIGVVLLPVPRASLGLGNAGDLVRLHGADGTILDEVRYDAGWHTPALATTDGVALVRIRGATDGRDPLAWTSSPDPHGGSPGLPNGLATSGAPPAEPGDVVINEILYEPVARDDDGRDDQPEYVELRNVAAGPRALDGLRLVGGVREDGSADTLRIAFGPSTLGAGGYAVAFRRAPEHDADAQLRDAFPDIPVGAMRMPTGASLGLGNEGDRVALVRADGLVLDDVAYRPTWHAAALRETAGVALERLDAPRGANAPTNWTSSVHPSGGTPGAPNSVSLVDGAAPRAPGIAVEPSPFSPDGDGVDDVAAIRYRLGATPASIRVRIFDGAGRLVRELADAALAAETGTVAWDGMDDDGHAVRVGIYVVHLEAVAAERGRVEAFKTVVVLARQL